MPANESLAADVPAGAHSEYVIKPGSGLFDIDVRELLHYRGLIWLLVRRDFVSIYKQTILGPTWFLLKPLLTTLTFVIIFGRVAKLSTDGLPHVLFYYSGTVMWFYFSDSFSKISSTFTTNAKIFRKVYFPRLVMPLATLSSNLLAWSLQFSAFIAFIVFYRLRGIDVHTNLVAALTPVLILLLAACGLGLGTIVAAFTTKYRDLSFLLSYGIQLLMYATPVIYPVSTIPDKYRWVFFLNPLTSIIETFRYGFLGEGSFAWSQLAMSAGIIAVLFLLGLSLFGRVEKTFVDLV